MNENLNKIDEYIKYNEALEQYEKYIKDKYSKNSVHDIILKGYLINLKDFEDLKKGINYDTYKLFRPNNKNGCLKLLNSSKETKFKKVRNIKLNSFKYLVNMLNNNNKYIIITGELWNVVGEKDNQNNTQIDYKIDKDYIIIEFQNQKKISFKHNKNNIIDIVGYNSGENIFKPNFDEIKKIYEDIKEYKKLESEFIYDIKKENNSNGENNKKHGFLISKSWIDKWKELSNYDEIDKNYNLNDEKRIFNNLIYHLEKNNLKYNELEKPEILNYNKKEEFDSVLLKNILILINDKFRRSFQTNNNLAYEISFNTNNNKIYIINDNKNEKLNYMIFKNMILSKESYNLLYLKYMIKFIYFQKEIKEQIISSHKTTSNTSDNINNIYIINKKVMNKYKEYFEFDILRQLLKEKINDISMKYENIDSNFSNIINILDKDNYLKRIKNKDIIEYFKLNKYNYEFNIKLQNEEYPVKKYYSYINDLDIINKDIYSFFTENNIFKTRQCFEGNYIAGDGKIFLLFNHDNNNFYEIGYFDSRNNFIIEYLIQEYNYNTKKDIINFFKVKGIDFIKKNYFDAKNKYEIRENTNKIICYYYKIKEKQIQKDNNIINNFDKNQNCNLDIDKEDNFVIEMINILKDILLLEKEIKNLIKDSKEKNISGIMIKDCYMINESIIIILKQLFLNNELEEYLLKNSEINFIKLDLLETKFQNNLIDFISRNKNKFFEIIKHTIFILEKKSLFEDKIILNYPINFSFIKKNIFLKIKALCKDIEKIKKEEVTLAFSKGKLLLKPNKNELFNVNDDNDSYTYIYLLKEENNNIIYNPEEILFYKNNENRNNDFNDMINGKKNYQNKYNSITYKLNKNTENDLKNSTEHIIFNENDINEYIKYAIIFFDESLNSQITNTKKNNNEYFLINKNYINKIESILKLDKISEILKKIRQINSKFKIELK